MVNRNLIREFDISEEEENAAIGTVAPEDIEWFGGGDVNVNQIVEGRVLRIDEEFILVDVGYKSEGIVPRNEWEEGEELPAIGETIRVLVEEVEDLAGQLDDRGMIVLSKRKAEKIEKWMKVMETVREGDVVTGNVTRKIKGGLLVDIGVNVFLPASQVDIRRPHDIGEYIGKPIQCLVLKIDEARRNIVVSRRSLIEQERAHKKAELLKELQIGQLRKGLWVASGFGRQGLSTTAMAGMLVARSILWGDERWRLFSPFELVWAGGATGRVAGQVIGLWGRGTAAAAGALARYRERARVQERIREARLAEANRLAGTRGPQPRRPPPGRPRPLRPAPPRANAADGEGTQS